MTIETALQQAKSQLKSAGISSYRLDSLILLEHLTGQPRTRLLTHAEEPLDSPVEGKFFDLIKQRSNRVPLVHLTQAREFYGLDLEITPDVLTPRVETEQMVDWAIKYAPPSSRLIDIGTGSGAIAIAMAANRPDLSVVGTEVSKKAMAIARRNATKHHLSIDFIESDLFAAVDAKFHTIVTNLPYLADDADLMPEVQREPAVALFGGGGGLDTYRRFLRELPAHMTTGSYVFTECDPWQQAELIRKAARAHLKPIEQGYFILGFQHES